MKADVCGKEKIAEHTKNPAQEMHRISTDGKFIHARKNYWHFNMCAPAKIHGA